MEEKLTEPDMETAQQLEQLSGSGQDDSEGAEHNEKKNKKKEEGGAGEAVTSSIPKGKEEEEKDEEEQSGESRPTKRQRFRSLAEIYRVTKPISDGCDGDGKKDMRRPGKKGMRRPGKM